MKFIGDIVLTTPVIRAVKESYPDAYIAYLGEKEGVSLLQNNPDLDEIIAYDFTKPGFLEQIKTIMRLRRKKFDVFIDLFSNPRTALLALASGAPIRIGKDVKGRGKFYTHRINDDGERKTAIQFHYQYLKPLGIEVRHWQTKIYLTDEERREAKIYLRWKEFDPDKPIVALHPGATWPAKIWDKNRFAALVDLINAKLGAQVLLTQGPNDRLLCDEVSRLAVGKLQILDVLPLRQLAAILSHCNALIANDSGPMHIAVAVGTPTIGIFGPGEEDIWFPYTPPFYPEGAGHTPLRKNVSCHPCHLNACNRTGEGFMECMKLLGIDEVFSVLQRSMNPKQNR